MYLNSFYLFLNCSLKGWEASSNGFQYLSNSELFFAPRRLTLKAILGTFICLSGDKGIKPFFFIDCHAYPHSPDMEPNVPMSGAGVRSTEASAPLAG